MAMFQVLLSIIFRERRSVTLGGRNASCDMNPILMESPTIPHLVTPMAKTHHARRREFHSGVIFPTVATKIIGRNPNCKLVIFRSRYVTTRVRSLSTQRWVPDLVSCAFSLGAQTWYSRRGFWFILGRSTFTNMCKSNRFVAHPLRFYLVHVGNRAVLAKSVATHRSDSASFSDMSSVGVLRRIAYHL